MEQSRPEQHSIRDCTGAIVLLLCATDEGAEAAFRAGGLRALVGVIRNNMEKAATVEAACTALRNLMRYSFVAKEAAGEAGVLEMITEVAQVQVDDWAVQVRGCEALFVAANGVAANCERAVGRASAVEAVTFYSLRAHKADPRVVAASCIALRAFLQVGADAQARACAWPAPGRRTCAQRAQRGGGGSIARGRERRGGGRRAPRRWIWWAPRQRRWGRTRTAGRRRRRRAT